MYHNLGYVAKLLLIACDNDMSISYDALDVANHNNEKLKLDVNFIHSDMLDDISDKYDVIISNPPYLSKEFSYVEDIVNNNEPSIALYADDNGMYFYNKILSTCSKNLKDRYIIAFEMDEHEGEMIKSLAFKYLGNDIDVNILKALNGNERFIIIKKINS